VLVAAFSFCASQWGVCEYLLSEAYYCTWNAITDEMECYGYSDFTPAGLAEFGKDEPK
jgi:hypothetical protein